VFERFASLLRFWPYRCDDCTTRFWRFVRNPVIAQRPGLPARETVTATATARRPDVSARTRRQRVPTPPSSALA
jgi:hypothetical protein